MQSKALIRLLVLCLAAISLSVFAKPIPIDSLARKPAINSVSMSADGKQLVALIAAPGTDYKDTALATWNLDDLDQEPVITASAERMKFINAFALKAGKILVTGRQEWTGPLAGCGEGNYAGSTATFVFKNYLTDAKHSEFDEAFTRGSQKIGTSEQIEKCLEIAGSARLINNLPLDPTKVIIRQIDSLSLQGNYFLYDLETEKTQLLLRAGPDAAPGLFHPRDGRLLIRTLIEPLGKDEYEQQVLIHNAETDEFEIHDKLTTKLSERYTVRVVGVDDKTGQFYVITDLFSELAQAWMYDPKTRSFGSEPLVAHGEYAIANLVFGDQPSNFNKILGFSISGPAWETTFVDPDMRAIHEGLKQAYPGQMVYMTDYNNDLSRILFMTVSGQNPTAYHLLIDRKKVQTLGKQRPWIDSADLGEQRWLTYTARDGLEIPAILDLPPGWKDGDTPLPTIIHPHGGPWARDYTGWDGSGLVPFFSSRGYAVLRPQYRGSTGLGRKLWLAGDAEWGKAMQDDKDDATQWLIEQGITDPDRVAIFGYSYGGFAAAAEKIHVYSAE